MKCKYNFAFIAALLIISTVLASCGGGGNQVKPHTRSSYEYFDTVSTVLSYANDSKEEFLQNFAEVEGILREYHRLFDIYYEYSGINNLKTINENAGIKPVSVDKKLIDFLVFAKDMYTVTHGEVNIAMGSVLRLWHNCREAAADDPLNAKIPNASELLSASEHTSIDALVIDEEKCTAYLSDPETSLDVGALGKGYAAERAAEHLKNKGVSSYVLNIGGNICTIGKKLDGTGWSTGVTNPDKTSDERFVVRLILDDIACVTSGNYERYYVSGGKKYHHIIDKDTLMPSEHFASVTVLASDSGVADAFSTALFNLSYADGFNLISTLGGLEALWVTNEGEIYMTDGFAERVIE